MSNIRIPVMFNTCFLFIHFLFWVFSALRAPRAGHQEDKLLQQIRDELTTNEEIDAAKEDYDKPKKAPKSSTKVGKRYAQSAEVKHDAIAVTTTLEPPSKFIALASSLSAASLQFLVCQVVSLS